MPAPKKSSKKEKDADSILKETEETISKILKNNRLIDVNLDFSDNMNIKEEPFVEQYLLALKKANPRSNHVVLQFLVNCKWRQFNRGRIAPKKRSRNQRVETSESSREVTKKRKRSIQFREETDSDSSEHNDICEYCEKPGELLLCDTCSGAYHFSCVNLKKSDVPPGEWNCPLCVEEAKRRNDAKTKKKDSKNKDKIENKTEDDCYHCSQPGGVVPCYLCSKFFHQNCAFPPLAEKPQKWKCQYCIAEPLEHQLEKIIFWKFVDVDISDYSYWEVAWISEFQLRAHSFPLYVAFVRKYDMTTPMLLEDGENKPDNIDPLIDLENMTVDDIYKTYIIYGIKQEWLQIQRILCVQKDSGGTNYLVKWRDLPHINCTWENRKARHLRKLCSLKKYVATFKYFVSEAIQRPSLFPKDSSKQKYKPYPSTPSFLIQGDLSLHNYQLEGLNWIRYSYFLETNVILADEMGLGKTIQTIVFLYSLYKERISPGPFLVVAPLSTLPNWEREFEIWAPEFYVVVVNMSRENREFIKNEEFYLNNCSPKIPKNSRKNFRFHVLLVSYEVTQIESSALRPIRWAVLVLDEAHRIKNKQSKLHQNLADYNTSYKLLLTGTPLQNNLEELFYLLNFLSPKDFSNAEEFLEEFRDLSKEKQIERIHNLLGKRLLRRLKSDVLKDIPVKSEVIVPVDLSSLQKKYYKAILNKNYTVLCQRGSSSSSILNILMDLKKCCNHPYLFNLSQDEQPYDETTGQYHYRELVEGSSKMVLLEKMLKGFQKKGHRVLIFSQMTKLLDLLEDFLNHNDWKFERIDGSVSTLNRQASIDRFNSKDSTSFVFLLSTRAGGLGINLASADTVIIFDSDWNPHNDIQALSRAHRLGQLKKVMIYRFVIRNTIEERILEVAKKKMMLTHLVVHSGLSRNENLTKRELDDILRFGTAQLFKNDSNTDQLEYDDKAIERLLDRDLHAADIPESGINEYFSSFKVIDVAVRQPIEKEPDSKNVESHSYWESLLGDSHEIAKELAFDEFGKGKRLRKQVKYVDHEIRDENDFDPDYDVDKETSSSSSEEESETNEPILESTPKILPKKEHWSIPLLTSYTCNMNVEAELRRKKNILNKLVLTGIPPQDLDFTIKKWGMEQEENFSVQEFKLFLRNTFASLDCTGSHFPLFIDKFPLDEVGCQSVLCRVGLIELIKNKILQYAPHHPYFLPILVDEHIIPHDEIPSDYSEKIRPFIVDPDISKSFSYSIRPPQNYHELNTMKLTFRFNIEDHSYTDLHIVWDAEQSIRDNNLWWRYHDLWLLIGVCVHGYNEFSAIFNDPRFSLLHLAFVNRKEDKLAFARRRLDLLEQALVIEDVVNRMIDQRVYLRHESNIIKMRNKILELNSIIESSLPVVIEFLSGKKGLLRPIQDVLNYCQFLCYDIKHDASNLSRYIVSSSLRSSQLFPHKNEDRFSLKITQPIQTIVANQQKNNGSS